MNCKDYRKVYKYFAPQEFEKCVPSCSIHDVSPELLTILDHVRESVGFPIVLTSAFRSKEYELSKGRLGTSSHCKGYAVDIRCSTSTERLALVSTFLLHGVHRIGIGNTFIHVDIDPDKTSAIWLY